MTDTAQAIEDGNLPAALTQLDDALHALTNPQTEYHNNQPIHAPSLYMQLWDAIQGEQATGHGVPRSMPPIWCDAADLLNEIDTAASAWQPQPDGIPPTVGRLKALRNRPWRPQDTHSINQITNALTSWAARITALLNPEHIKHVSAPCPSCGATTVYRKDSAGETVRQPALQIVTETGCTCQKCHAHWGPERYLFLCKLLDMPLPEGVLE